MFKMRKKGESIMRMEAQSESWKMLYETATEIGKQNHGIIFGIWN